MSQIGYGYGSEWHLLRYLGYHRDALSEQLREAIPQFDGAKFLDLPFRSKPQRLNRESEFQGLEFIQSPSVLAAWKSFWPTSGNAMCWDAIAVAPSPKGQRFFLFEAKAHEDELRSTCGACPESRAVIDNAFSFTRTKAGTKGAGDWGAPYYQYCNRLAALCFLREHGIDAHLVFLYFTGENYETWKCPRTADEWTPSLAAVDSHVGAITNPDIAARIHKIYVPIQT